MVPPQKILSEHSGSGSQRTRSADPKPSLLENPRSSLSPLTNSLLEQLEARIKELKVWLRDTELLIFNSCLREHKDATQQLQSFKVATGCSLSGFGSRSDREDSPRTVEGSFTVSGGADVVPPGSGAPSRPNHVGLLVV